MLLLLLAMLVVAVRNGMKPLRQQVGIRPSELWTGGQHFPN